MPDPTQTTRYAFPLQAAGNFGRLRLNAALQAIDNILNANALTLASLVTTTTLGNIVSNEIPGGAVAAGNLNFTLVHLPIVGTSSIKSHGGDLIEGVHYNLGSGTKTLAYIAGFEPFAGEPHTINYKTTEPVT